MPKAKHKDKSDVVEIIQATFLTNPSVNTVIGEKGNRSKKIGRMAEYTFTKSINRNGAFISQNRMGAALFFRSTVKKFDLKEFYYEIKFALSIPPKKVIQTLQREKYLKKNRAYSDYYFYWFLGVKKGGDKAAFELSNEVFDIARRDNLPILLETSVARNKNIYERYGFEVYHEWDDTKNGITLWFMKWIPN